jgi:hypothetical protein
MSLNYWLLLADRRLHRRLFGQVLRRISVLPVPKGCTPIAFAKSGAEEFGTVSENSITRQQAGLVRRAKRSAEDPLLAGPVLMVIRCVQGGRSITMHERKIQIGNSC